MVFGQSFEMIFNENIDHAQFIRDILVFCLFFLYLYHLKNNNKNESNMKFLVLYPMPSVENELISYTQ